MEPLKAYLDANILFSAAVGGPAFDLLWSLSDAERVGLFSSRTCVIEAERNLQRKRRDALQHFDRRMHVVQIVPDVTQFVEGFGLPPKDAPIYASAVAIAADVFLTGDLRHFGGLMGRTDVPVQVQTVRAFLLESPE